MRAVNIKNSDDGRTYIEFNQIAFDKENQSIELVASFPQMEGFTKRIEWDNRFAKGYFVGDTEDTMSVLLTSNMMLTGKLYIQCMAVKNDKVIKYQIKSININNSLNVLSNDTTVTLSIAEILQNQIDQAIARIVELENRTLEDFPFGREE